MKGCIYKRGERKWALVIDLPRDPSGKRRQKWHTVEGTKKEAERELTRLLHEMNTGGYVEPSKETVAQYLERWIKEYAKPSTSAKTCEDYEGLIRRQIAPALGHYPLDKLQPLHIQGAYREWGERGRKDGTGGLSAKTIRHCHTLLKEALEQAVRWQIISRNPVAVVPPPRLARTERPTLDAEGIGRVVAVAAGTKLHVPILLAVATGLRRGEILALRWQDVDLDAGVLFVNQSLEHTTGSLRFKTPKTSKSRRPVTLPAFLVEALVRHRAEQAEHRLLVGPSYQNHHLVVARDDGLPLHPDGFTHGFAKLVARAGVQKVRFHDLRHSHATQLLKGGVHPKVVSERLGHSGIGITLDLYSHVVPGMQEEVARQLDAALRSAVAGG
jgi:integrase